MICSELSPALTPGGPCATAPRAMFRTTDLKVVAVATNDLEGAVTTFQKNFGFPTSRDAKSSAEQTRSRFLAIGGAEIEMVAPAGDGSPLAAFLAERGPGLHTLVLEVDDLGAAVSDLAARGFRATLRRGDDGRDRALLDPAQTHGAPIALVGRGT